VLGFNAHLAIQFGIDLAKPPRRFPAALVCRELDVRGAGETLQPVDIHHPNKTIGHVRSF
jgi:hypothetical protein